jgi:nucleotide-binding universal stress UspA family protein
LTASNEFNTFQEYQAWLKIHIIPKVQTRKENKMKILVGYDGSKVAEDALKLAREHARVFKADIHLLRSLQQGPDLKKEDIEKAESKLDKLKLNFDFDKISCKTHASVTFMTPFGSTAQLVILEAPCPVITVK